MRCIRDVWQLWLEQSFFCSMSMDHLHLHLLDTPATLWPAFGFEPRTSKDQTKPQDFLAGSKTFSSGSKPPAIDPWVTLTEHDLLLAVAGPGTTTTSLN
jgi:hypothetical protein